MSTLPWLNIIAQIIILAERFLIPGNKKKYLVIETVVLVIKREVPINDSEKKIELGYALGKAYSDTKNFDKSFAHYKEANFLQRKKI